MKISVVVQARTGSTRLPGKVLLPLAGEPMLRRQLERILGASTPFSLIVATTSDPSDDPVRDLCRDMHLPCYSGHPTDLLDRHLQAARTQNAEVVVKIPCDCPLIDPRVIDRVLQCWIEGENNLDYVSNLHPASYPDGQDVEVLPIGIMQIAWKEAGRDFEREHTTPFIWERPERFRLGNVVWETGLDYSMTHRWTIDYPDDYEFIRSVYDELWSPQTPLFSLEDVLDLLRNRPDLGAINQRHAGVNWYRHHRGELRTISAAETRTAPGSA